MKARMEEVMMAIQEKIVDNDNGSNDNGVKKCQKVMEEAALCGDVTISSVTSMTANGPYVTYCICQPQREM